MYSFAVCKSHKDVFVTSGCNWDMYWAERLNGLSSQHRVESSPRIQVTSKSWVNESVSQWNAWLAISQWNAWLATGRSALQDLQSCVILQASLTLSPVSSSICCIHVRQGRPRWRFHSGLMSGLPPAWASAARRSTEWAGVASGSCRVNEGGQ